MKQIPLLLLLVSLSVAHAQQTPPPPPIIGWGFDEFHIGGEMLFYPRIGRDSFNMDFIYHYGGFPSMDYLAESVVPHVNDSVDRRNFRSMLLEAAANGMKVVYAPKNVFNFWPGTVTNSLETYFDFRSDTLSLTDFLEKVDAGLCGGYGSVITGHERRNGHVECVSKFGDGAEAWFLTTAFKFRDIGAFNACVPS